MNRFTNGLFGICTGVAFSVSSCFVSPARADVTITSPGGAGVSIASAPDYATEVLGDPWDFDGAHDLADFIDVADIGSGISSPTVSGGHLNFTIQTADNAYFHMLSPGQCNSNPLGKNGQALPIDTTRYKRLVIRMYSSATDSMHVLWYTGCNYANAFRRSGAITVYPGWHVYDIDLETLAYNTNMGESRSWRDAGRATGLRIDPGSVAGSTRQIDWILLAGTADATTGHTDVSYVPVPEGNADRYSLFLDDDGNPFNGVTEWLVQGAAATGAVQTKTVNSGMLFPAEYVVGGFLSDDFMTLHGAPWDFEEMDDLQNYSLITNARLQNGTLFGTTSSTLPALNLRGNTFNANTYRYLCARMDAGANGKAGVIWSDGTSAWPVEFNVSAGTKEYTFDMASASPNWAGTVTALVLQPNTTPGVNFSMEWVALRKNGCASSDIRPNVDVANGTLIVNRPPILEILQPDKKGGADFAATVLGNPWNMDTSSDVVLLENLSGGRIYPNNVQYGRQGDFFCATSELGNDDPHQVSYKNSNGPFIDASRFKNTTVEFYVDRQQDVVNGSVLRLIAGDGLVTYWNGDDTFYKGLQWDRLVQDMTEWRLEELIHPNPPSPTWNGQYGEFRADIHEFSEPTTFCIDKIQIRADDEADSRYAITYDLHDLDTDPSDVDVSFFYTQTPGATTGGTPIAGAQHLPMNRNSRQVEFDTSKLAAGTYSIYGVASDGLNELRKAAPGRLVVDHSGTVFEQNQTAPSMSLEEPSDGRSVYKSSNMIVSGWAVDDIELALVEVLFDGQFATSFVPYRFHKGARSAHPTYADASNAGFFESVSLAGLSIGGHAITVRACDTHGNCTSETRKVTVRNGADPSPVQPPSPENEASIPVGDVSNEIQSTLTREGHLTFTLTNTDLCTSSLTLYGGVDMKKLRKRKRITPLVSLPASLETTRTLTASDLPFMKKPRKRVLRNGRVKRGNKKLFFAVDCNGQMGPIRMVNFKQIRKKKPKRGKGKFLREIQSRLVAQ